MPQGNPAARLASGPSSFPKARSATLRILARNIESDTFRQIGDDPYSPWKLQFGDFSVEFLGNQCRLKYARQFFCEAMIGECLIEREYQSIPRAPQELTGVEGILSDAEELLLLLRLFRPGDLAFVSVTVQGHDSTPTKLYPNRMILDSVHNSPRPYRIDNADVPGWEPFVTSLKSSAAWKSTWFNMAKRWFLYGGAKEFNPNFESGIDRVADYVAALEAVLTPESGQFIQRRLGERAIRLLGSKDKDASAKKKILKRLYGIRSTLVHGSPVSDKDLSYMQDSERWSEFDQIVRDLLVAAIRKMPAEAADRVTFLAELYEPSDVERAEDFAKNFKTIKSPQARRELLCKLVGEL